jgi:flagellar biosynthetic protein FliP
VRARGLVALVLLTLTVLDGVVAGQETGTGTEPRAETSTETATEAVADAGTPGANAARPNGEPEGAVKISTAVEIALLLTLLSVLPALVITVTSFTRIVIVLSFVRRSLSVNELPPNPVIIALSLFLTTFVMGPVFTRAYEKAYVPYREGVIGTEQAVGTAWGELRGFLVANTRVSEVELFLDLAKVEKPVDDGGALVQEALPFRVVVPAFVLSELKTSFQMGFLLFLPFLVIDLVVASVLISMGMFMLPPVMISTPFKILLFVLVDGWHLVCQSLVTSFVTS